MATSLKDADVVIAMVDAAGRTPKQALDGLLPAFVQKSGVPLVVALNKCDLLKMNQVTDLIEFYTAKYQGLAEVSGRLLCISLYLSRRRTLRVRSRVSLARSFH